MATDAETITARCVSMDEVVGARASVAFWVEQAIAAHTKTAWKDKSSDPYAVYYTAMACWALHRVIMAGRAASGANTPSGPVQSKRNGDVSVTYAISGGQSPGIFAGDLPQTTWGLLYLQYQATLGGPVAVC